MTKKLIIILGVLLAGAAVWAGPDSIRFQGRLTDGNGRPIIGPEVKVKFKLYTAQTGGTKVWPATDMVTTVATNDVGLFSTDVGSLTTDVFSNNPSLYLEISVHDGAGYEDLKPRQKLGTVPYAFRSESAAMAADVPNGAITAAKIQDGAVTQIKVALNSIGNGQIIDDAVSASKIQDEAVTSEKVLDGEIGRQDIAVAAITADKLAPELLTGDGPTLVPVGAIFMFLNACPIGFSEVTELRNRYPIGADTASLDPHVPDATSQNFGTKTPSHRHSHDMAAHKHVTGIHHPQIPHGPQGYGLGEAWPHGTTEVVSKIVALNHTALIPPGKSDPYEFLNTGPSEPNTTGETEPDIDPHLPPSLTVLFCRKG